MILIRFILVLLNVDIIPMNVKKALNSAFICNPEEMIVYIFMPLTAKFKRLDYDTALVKEKEKYQN